MTKPVYAQSRIIADLSKELEETIFTFVEKSEEGVAYMEILMACDIALKEITLALKEMKK